MKKEKRNKIEPVIYINKNISVLTEDFVGFDSQVESLNQAINNGASMVGVVGDYGSGKSSLGNMIATKKTKFRKTIKISMWDSLTIPKENPDNDKLSVLNKSFLFQTAKGSGNRNLTSYVSKRINKSTGILSVSIRSASFWVFFSLALLFLFAGIFLSASNFNFNVWGYTIDKNFYIIAYFIAAVFLILGLRKSGIAFSSWKSENTKELDTSDVFDIYGEIIKSISGKFRKRLIIIEDLDRINNRILFNNFIKEIYRFNTLSQQQGIIFLLAIKPESQLETTSEKDKISYSKLFDYIVELKPLHFDDYSSVILDLLKQQKLQIKTLTGIEVGNELPSEFSWIVKGRNLTIRDLKLRLNNMLQLYASIKSKQLKSAIQINLSTCAAVTYLQAQFEKEFYELIGEEEKISEVIKSSYTIRLTSSVSYEQKLLDIKNSFDANFYDKNKKPIFSNLFVNELSQLLLNGTIDSDYRLYFYSYPKGSYIKSIEESALEEYIIFNSQDNQRNALTIEKLEELVGKTMQKSEKIIVDSFKQLVNRKILLPIFIINNRTLFSIASKKFFDDAVNLLTKNFLWNKENEQKTLDNLIILTNYNLEEIDAVLKAYSNIIIEHVLTIPDKGINLRKKLLKEIGERIKLYAYVFLAKGMPLITEEELNLISSDSLKIQLINEDNFDVKAFNTTIRTFLVNKLENQSYLKVESYFLNMIKSYPAQLDNGFIENSILFLSLNKTTNETIFSCVAQSKFSVSMKQQIVQYINSLQNPISKKYCDYIAQLNLVSGLNNNTLRQLYEFSFFLIYLINHINNETLDSVDLLDKNFNEQIFREINKFSEEYLIKFREYILSSKKELLGQFEFLFLNDFPILHESELKYLSYKDAMQLIELIKITEDNFNILKNVFTALIETTNDCLSFFLIVLNKDYKWAKNLFDSLDFSKTSFQALSIDEKEQITNLYIALSPITTAEESIQYLYLIDTLVPSIEKNIENATMTGKLTEIELEKFIALINKINFASDVSINILEQYDYRVPLADGITDKLFGKGKYTGYTVGKTLLDKHFQINGAISVPEYLDIYKNTQCIQSYMESNIKFLDMLYDNNDFSGLDIRQLYLFKTRPQSITLIKEVFKHLKTKDDVKDYIFNIPEIKTQEDSAAFCDFFCTEENKKYFDKDVYNRARDLLWVNGQASHGKKMKLTKFFKSIFGSNN